MSKSIEKTVYPDDITVLKERLGEPPTVVIKNFFDYFEPNRLQEEMLELLFEAMRSRNVDYSDWRTRDDRIFLYEQVLKLATAVYIQYKAPSRMKKKKR